MTQTAPAPGAADRPVRRHAALGWLALALALAAVLAAAVGAVGAKLGAFTPRLGFNGLTLTLAALLAVLGTALGLIALGMAAFVRPRGRVRPPLAAVIVGGAALVLFAAFLQSASRKPPVHDVATDWREALMPSQALIDVRGAKAEPVEADPVVPASPLAKSYAGQRMADVNVRTCPAATPVILAQPVDKAYTRLRDTARGQGLRIFSDDVRTGRLEATATSFWYGFKDDLIARVRPEGAGARIDLRSVSRQGRLGPSDLGSNCARIGRLRAALAG